VKSPDVVRSLYNEIVHLSRFEKRHELITSSVIFALCGLTAWSQSIWSVLDWRQSHVSLGGELCRRSSTTPSVISSWWWRHEWTDPTSWTGTRPPAGPDRAAARPTLHLRRLIAAFCRTASSTTSPQPMERMQRICSPWQIEVLPKMDS